MGRKNSALRDALWIRGYRQADLAEQLGVDPAVVSRIINGRAQASEARKREIARILGVPLCDLFPESPVSWAPPRTEARDR